MCIRDSHAKAANVPIIVAINKMDKLDANPDRVKQQLMEVGLVPEEFGGQTIMVPVSARRKEGIDGLLEMILLVSEMAEFKANPNRTARGVVIESKLDKARGPVATILVKTGTIKVGDNVVAGSNYVVADLYRPGLHQNGRHRPPGLVQLGLDHD